MTFLESIKTCLTKKYGSITGRASRSEYWWFVLFYTIGTLILGYFAGFASIITSAYGYEDVIFLSGPGGILFIIFVLAMIIPCITVSIRRLHDLDRSGWWFLVSLIPLGSLLLSIYFLFKGTDGANSFGEDPLA